MNGNKKLVIYGAMWCPDTLRALEFYSKNSIEFEFKSIDENLENTRFVEELNKGLRIIPTIILPNGSTLTEPATSELEKSLKLFK